MNTKATEAAFITASITCLTSLVTLLSQPEVSKLSEVSEVGFVSALLGGLLAGFTTYKARVSEP